MKKVFEHIDFSRVGHFQSILENAGIATHIKNVGAAIASGEIPFIQVFPELWVVEDGDYDRAIEILKPYYRPEAAEAGDWVCPGCGETVEGSFGQCWKCQTMRPQTGAEPDSTAP